MLPFGNVQSAEYDSDMTNMPGGILGNRIAERIDVIARTRSGYTQEDLATAVKVSPAAISRYISGVRKPTAAILARIAKELETTVDYLHGLTEESRRPDAPPLSPIAIEFDQILEGVSGAALDDIKNVVRLLAESDRQRQQMARENRFFLDVVEGAGTEAVDALVDTLQATRDPALRRERLTAWLDANFPLGDLTSEP